MAEGWLRHLKGHNFNAYSAGIETHGLNPLAVQVMQEVGVDISQQKSKHVDELDDIDFDVVISVCAHADQTCPAFHKEVKRVFQGFEDPPKIAKELTDEEQILNCYRQVRDQIKSFVLEFEENLLAA